jgi:hypothetical protein
MAFNNYIYGPALFATQIRLELRGLRLKLLYQASDTSTYIRDHLFNLST